MREQPVEVEGEARELVVVGRVPRDRERRRERRLVVEQLLGAVAHALGLDEQRERGVGEQVRQEVLTLGEPRQPRLHAVEHLTVGEALPLLAAPTLRAQELRGALADGRGGEQLTRREDPRLVDVVGGALVGDRERRQPVDLVAPEVDADGVVVGGRVDVDDRAAHGDLAARLHLVLAPVAARDQRLDQLVAVDPASRPDHDRLDLLDVRPEPLHERAHRRHHDGGRVVGMAEPPEHAEPPAHRLERRRHPLERQRLPRREQLDLAELGEPAPRNCVRSRARRSASAPVGTATTSGRRVVTPGERGHEQRPGRVGDRHRRGARDDRAQRRLLGEHRRELGERQGCDVEVQSWAIGTRRRPGYRAVPGGNAPCYSGDGTRTQARRSASLRRRASGRSRRNHSEDLATHDCGHAAYVQELEAARPGVRGRCGCRRARRRRSSRETTARCSRGRRRRGRCDEGATARARRRGAVARSISPEREKHPDGHGASPSAERRGAKSVERGPDQAERNVAPTSVRARTHRCADRRIARGSFRHQLKRFIATSTPSVAIASTASAACSMVTSISPRSRFENRRSTWSTPWSFDGGLSTPIRTRW